MKPSIDSEEKEDSFIETSVFDHLAFNVFIFVTAIISVIVRLIVVKLICKEEKMQMLLANLAIIKGAKAINEENKAENKEYWIIIIWLSLILLCHFISDYRKSYIECQFLENIAILIQLK